MRRWAPIALACLVAPAAASAQTAVGVGLGPDAFSFGGRERRGAGAAEPLALAVALSFDTGTWLAVAVSTSAPARDLDALVRKGAYKLELIQLTLMARGSGKTLAALAARREKGQPLRGIAEELKLEYDPLYDRSLDVSRRVDERLLTLSRVGPLPEPGAPGGKR